MSLYEDTLREASRRGEELRDQSVGAGGSLCTKQTMWLSSRLGPPIHAPLEMNRLNQEESHRRGQHTASLRNETRQLQWVALLSLRDVMLYRKPHPSSCTIRDHHKTPHVDSRELSTRTCSSLRPMTTRSTPRAATSRRREPASPVPTPGCCPRRRSRHRSSQSQPRCGSCSDLPCSSR